MNRRGFLGRALLGAASAAVAKWAPLVETLAPAVAAEPEVSVWTVTWSEHSLDYGCNPPVMVHRDGTVEPIHLPLAEAP